MVRCKNCYFFWINYGPHKNPLENLINKDYGNISVYARGEDYHKIIKKI